MLKRMMKVQVAAVDVQAAVLAVQIQPTVSNEDCKSERTYTFSYRCGTCK